MIRILILIALLLLAPLPAFAGKGAPSPYVTKGKYTLTTDGFTTFDSKESRDDQLRKRFTLDSGITDQLGLRFRLTYEKPARDSFVFKEWEFGGKYELAEKGEWPVDVALYSTIRLQSEHNSAHKIDARVLLGKQIGKWNHVGNIMFLQDIGPMANGATTGELRARSDYQLYEEWAFGYEYFGNFKELRNLGDDNGKAHQFGPSVIYKPPGTPARFSLIYLFGLTDNDPNGLLKWQAGIDF